MAYSPNLLGARIGMALQGDGKILLVGGLKLLRLKIDGSPDASFGAAGVVDVVFAGGGFHRHGCCGAGRREDPRRRHRQHLRRRLRQLRARPLDTDGSLDTTFGSDGHVTTDFFGSADQVRRMKLQADGKILVVGLAVHPITHGLPPSSPSPGTTRTGRPTSAVAINGKTTDSPGSSLSVANGLGIQSDGEVTVAGSTAASGGDEPDTGFVRYLGDGQVKLPAPAMTASAR